MFARTRFILTAATALVAVLFTAMIISVHSTDTLSREKDLVAHTYSVLLSARQVHLDIVQAETVRRAYLIAPSEYYRDSFARNVEEARSGLTKLRDLVGDNSPQVRRVDEIIALFGKRFAIGADELKSATDGNDLDAARQSLFRPEAREIVQQMLTVISNFANTELELLATRREAVSDSIRDTTRVTLALFGSALVGIIGLTTFLAFSNRRLRQVQLELARQAGVLQSTLENCNQGIAAFGTTGHLTAYNKRFFDLIDYKNAVEGKTISLDDILGSEYTCQNAELQKLLSAPFADAKPGTPAQRLRALVGKRTLEISRNGMTDGGFLVVSEDITTREQAEAVLRQSQKMDAIGQLTGGIAHDFNNLLQVIGTNLSLLERSVQSDPKALARLNNATTGVKRGATLTAQLLAFARRQPLDPHPINLGRLVGETVDLLRRTLGEEIEIETVVAGGLWNTLADQAHIENAILNLALNARDAMPNGGRLTIELANANLDENYASEHVEVKAGQYVMLAVTDSGTGMTPAVADRIFEPFFTTKPEGHGTGLGLAQVYGFVKQSGGHIKVYTEVGHGTTFKIYLPRTRLPDEFTGNIPLTPTVGGSETILVVEDDQNVRTAAVDQLIDLGYKVLQAATTEAGLAILQSGAKVDLLFTDVVMPGSMAPREMARRAQEIQPQMRVLFTSGYTSNSIVHDGRLDEGVDLLSKPYTRDELARKVRNVLAS